MGYEDDLNLYQYVGNDPLNMVDVTGRTGIAVSIARAIIAWETADVATPEPTDAVPAKWIVYAVAGGAAALVLLNEANEDGDDVDRTPGGRPIPEHGSQGSGQEYIEGKGWTGEQVDETIDNPDRTEVAQDTRGGRGEDRREPEPATRYIDSEGNHVVVNDETSEIVSVNDRNKTVSSMNNSLAIADLLQAKGESDYVRMDIVGDVIEELKRRRAYLTNIEGFVLTPANDISQNDLLFRFDHTWYARAHLTEDSSVASCEAALAWLNKIVVDDRDLHFKLFVRT